MVIYFSIWGFMWLKQCHKPSPSHHHGVSLGEAMHDMYSKKEKLDAWKYEINIIYTP
jgi:hypothetical protein